MLLREFLENSSSTIQEQSSKLMNVSRKIKLLSLLGILCLIEIKRSLPNCIAVSLHPGTVDTNLSKPYQRGVPMDKLFSPDYAVENLLKVIDNLTIADSGCFFSWNGEKLDY